MEGTVELNRFENENRVLALKAEDLLKKIISGKPGANFAFATFASLDDPDAGFTLFYRGTSKQRSAIIGSYFPPDFKFPAYSVLMPYEESKKIERWVVTPLGVLPELFFDKDGKFYMVHCEYYFNQNGQALKFSNLTRLPSSLGKSIQDTIPSVDIQLAKEDVEKQLLQPMALETGDYELIRYLLNQSEIGKTIIKESASSRL